jgi:hypothetical protein
MLFPIDRSQKKGCAQPSRLLGSSPTRLEECFAKSVLQKEFRSKQVEVRTLQLIEKYQFPDCLIPKRMVRSNADRTLRIIAKVLIPDS